MNRTIKFGPLLSSSADTVLTRVLPPAPRRFRTTILANAGPANDAMVERVTEAGSATETTRPLDLTYPPEVFSLSHLALPFPTGDGLYGMRPDPNDDFGINLGAMATRGERGALIISLDFPPADDLESVLPVPARADRGGRRGRLRAGSNAAVRP